MRTPEDVIAAARYLTEGRPDVLTVAWERGTSVVVVHAGDRTVGKVMRYVLSQDLEFVVVKEWIA